MVNDRMDTHAPARTAKACEDLVAGATKGFCIVNDEDLALYQQALANSGQLAPAHQMFCSLRERNPDIEILFGIATTTSNPVEAQQIIDAIKQLQPYHPNLPQLEALHNRKMLQVSFSVPMVPMAPILTCPYCGQRAPVIIRDKISTGGWVTFAVLLFVFFPLCWIGLLIKEIYYMCSHRGSRITAAG